MSNFIQSVYDSSWFSAFTDFMADYGLYIAAVGIGFLAAIAWWWHCHPEDFASVQDEEPEEDVQEEINQLKDEIMQLEAAQNEEMR